jgi:hypothetical protein
MTLPLATSPSRSDSGVGRKSAKGLATRPGQSRSRSTRSTSCHSPASRKPICADRANETASRCEHAPPTQDPSTTAQSSTASSSTSSLSAEMTGTPVRHGRTAAAGVSGSRAERQVGGLTSDGWATGMVRVLTIEACDPFGVLVVLLGADLSPGDPGQENSAVGVEG